MLLLIIIGFIIIFLIGLGVFVSLIILGVRLPENLQKEIKKYEDC